MKTVTAALIFTFMLVPGDWKYDEIENRMTGEVTHVFSSDWVAPYQALAFPYGDTKAMVAILCRAGDLEAIAVDFNVQANIANAEYKPSHNVIPAQLRIGGDVQDVQLRQLSTGGTLFFAEPAYLMPTLMTGQAARIGLQWHGEGQITFDFDFSGLLDHERAIARRCGM